jgi:cytochrome c-type biogenesis protein
VGSVLGISKAGWMYIVAAVCVLVGLNMSGLITVSFDTFMPAQSKWSKLSGYGGALVLGMLFGLVASPCAMPILTLILALVAQKGQMAYGSLLMFTYSIGHGMPLIIIGTVAGALTSMERFTQYSVLIQRIGGWLLIGVGAYFIWTA